LATLGVLIGKSCITSIDSTNTSETTVKQSEHSDPRRTEGDAGDVPMPAWSIESWSCTNLWRRHSRPTIEIFPDAERTLRQKL
jgi:hypothetical protein